MKRKIKNLIWFDLILTSCFVLLGPEPYVNTNTFYLIIRLNCCTELKQMNSWKKIKKRSGFPFPGLGMAKTYLLQHPTSFPPSPTNPHWRALRIGKRENWFQVTRTTRKKNHRVHTEWQWPIYCVQSIMMEKSTLAGEGGRGCTPTPFHSITIAYKVALPVFRLYPYMYSVEKPASFLTICERKLV